MCGHIVFLGVVPQGVYLAVVGKDKQRDAHPVLLRQLSDCPGPIFITVDDGFDLGEYGSHAGT